MRCWSDDSIERAALLMAEAGIAPGCAPGAAVSPDLVSLLEHTIRCSDCRKRLHTRFDAVILMRERQRGSTRVPLHIAPYRSTGLSRYAVNADGAESYSLAAQTPGSGAPWERGVEPTRVLTLTTGDDHYLVRIFANDADSGATAILFPVRRGVALEFQGTKFSFDENGCASLPGFPDGEISLIL